MIEPRNTCDRLDSSSGKVTRHLWFAVAVKRDGEMEGSDNFYSFKAKKLDGTTLNFDELRGKVVLIENVASL